MPLCSPRPLLPDFIQGPNVGSQKLLAEMKVKCSPTDAPDWSSRRTGNVPILQVPTAATTTAEHQHPARNPNGNTVTVVHIIAQFLNRLDHVFERGHDVLKATSPPSGDDNHVLKLLTIPRVQSLVAAVLKLLLAMVERVTEYVPHALPEIVKHIFDKDHTNRYGRFALGRAHLCMRRHDCPRQGSITRVCRPLSPFTLSRLRAHARTITLPDSASFWLTASSTSSCTPTDTGCGSAARRTRPSPQPGSCTSCRKQRRRPRVTRASTPSPP